MFFDIQHIPNFSWDSAMSVWILAAEVILDTMVKFMLVAGVLQGVLSSLYESRFAGRKIQARSPSRSEIGREMKLSLRSCVVFGLVGTFAIYAREHGLSLEYQKVEEHGWGYLVFSIWAMMAIHDVWHFSVHRACHVVPWLYRRVHRIHHTFSTPTPWSADAFHWADALLNISFLPLLIFVLPLHTVVIKTYLIAVVVLNTLGHSGYELMPAGLTRHWLGRFINTTTAHDLHHQKVHCNYGLYTNILDRWFNSYHPETAALYERVAGAGRVEESSATIALGRVSQ